MEVEPWGHLIFGPSQKSSVPGQSFGSYLYLLYFLIIFGLLYVWYFYCYIWYSYFYILYFYVYFGIFIFIFGFSISKFGISISIFGPRAEFQLVF